MPVGAARMTRTSLPWVVLAAAFPLLAVAVLTPQTVTQTFVSSGYMPHGHCYLWQPQLIALHGVSDFLIGLSYLVISLTLAYLVYRARSQIPFHWMVLAFGAFIIACGMTHFIEVWTLWHPTYWLAGDVKLITAMASVGTAVALPPLVPRILHLIRAETLAEERGHALRESTALLAREQVARARAEEADRAKDQFLAMVSHELRNPLSPILAWARMLRAGGLPADKQHAAVEAIERNAMAQAQLVEDLLDVSRIVSGKLRLDVRPTGLERVVAGALDAVRPSADARQVRLQVVLDPRPGMVLGDPDRLQQVAWTLLSNAVKFTPRGGRVQVGLERVDSHLELTVSDTGQGIAPELLPRVFERFWQADAGTTRTAGGLGLGLAIVRHLVELHGGSVSAHSDGVGQGASFTVRLPLMVMRDAARAPERRHPTAVDRPATPDVPRLDGVCVLVVDDEPDSNEMVAVLLASHGAEVRVAASAAQALAILERWRPHVLVSDIGMPEVDGFELIRRVRERDDARAHVPAIALTAYARVEDRVRSLTAGFQMHVTKPVDPFELVAVVASVARAPAPPA